MLAVEKISVWYGGAQALSEVSLALDEGEAIAIIGRNGAGKTSLLKAISGLVPMKGTITFKEEKIDHLSPHLIVKRGIIHCPEGRQLFGEMSVRENLQLGAFLYSDPRRVNKRLREVYELFPVLEERASQRASTLSGGEQQMVAIGRAFMEEPQLLMLDEPSLGLAPILKQNIANSIKEIWERGISLILVEQDSELALEIAEEVYILEDGEVIIQGTPKELRDDPRVKEAYLGVE